jgi:hypothetical protein
MIGGWGGLQHSYLTLSPLQRGSHGPWYRTRACLDVKLCRPISRPRRSRSIWARTIGRPWLCRDQKQPKREVDVTEKAMPESKSTQEPASSSDQSELASFTSAAATVTQPPPAQVPVPATVVATREPAPQQTAPDFVTRHLAAMNWRRCFSGRMISSSPVISLRRGFYSRASPKPAMRGSAFTLAGTFDPNVLKALGEQDGAPDIALARLWYERAAQLGSADAPRRLQQLATVSVP